MSFDPMLARLIEAHPERIREYAWRYLLPIRHPRCFKRIRVPVSKQRRHPNAILPTQAPDGRISIDEIMRQICAKHALSRTEVLSHSRHQRLCQARFEFCYRAATETLNSYPKIGQFLANRDHSTVIHGIRMWCKRYGLPNPRGMTPAPDRPSTRKSAERQ